MSEWRYCDEVSAKIKVDRIEYHRNGISGAGFNVIHFYMREGNQIAQEMLAIVFSETGYIAIIEPDNLSSKWRGDRFENFFRQVLNEHYDALIDEISG